MKKMTLYANGCSMTKGYEIGGRTDGDSDHPSGVDIDPIYRQNNAWPKLLADRLGMDCFNDAHVGGSNDRIIRMTLDWTTTYLQNNKAEDLFVVIGWTTPHRNEFKTNGKWFNISPRWNLITRKDTPFGRRIGEINEFYANYISDEYVDNTRSKNNMLLLQSWLKVNKISYLFCNGLITDILPSHIPNIVDCIDQNFYYGYGDPSLCMKTECDRFPSGPKNHPLEEGHKHWAGLLYDFIEKNKIVS